MRNAMKEVPRLLRLRLYKCRLIVISLSSLPVLSGCWFDINKSFPAPSAPTPTYTLSATVSGLGSSGLVLSVNGTDVAVASGASTLVLARSLASNTRYAVTVKTQPLGATCSIAGGSGTIGSANAANVVVTCADQAYLLGGSISGLNGGGLVLANGAETVAADAAATSFVFPIPVAYSSSYIVTVQTQPAGLACAVSRGSGTMPASAVTNVAVSCTDQAFNLGGSITGLGGNSGLELNNGLDTLAVAAGSTTFTMPGKVSFGSSYAVQVQSSPAGMTCTASSAAGTMPAMYVTNVVIACSDRSYSVGGTVSGLSSIGLVLANGSDALTVAAGSTGFAMPTPVAFESPYNVTVQTQPTGLTCSVSGATGTMSTMPVSSVAVTCAANAYTIGGSISGLNVSGLVLLDNDADATSISANATQFTMNTGLAYASAYAVTVQTQPAGETCTVGSGTGNVGAADITSVAIACAPWTFTMTSLYSFSGSPNGANPSGGLIQASDGSLYGTTQGGGGGQGTVFKIPLGGIEGVLYPFVGSPRRQRAVLREPRPGQ
jgi:uncharacterized repeat protein (TIGR03803 family)